MILAAHQPQYLPWLGYFEKIHRSDIFVFLDNVQYKKNEWQNRNRIKTDTGPAWLTVPVHYRFPQKIMEVTIDEKSHWQKKHIASLELNYSNTSFFKRYFASIQKIIRSRQVYLSELNIALIEELMSCLGIFGKTVISSKLGKLPEDPDERLISLCRMYEADTYLAGEGGKNYMDLDKYHDAGIKVIFQEYRHPVYKQKFDDFLSHLSAVDLLFNCGGESLSILTGGNK